MKLGTHNSMSYLPPKKWYLYPFRFMARCQSKNIEEQYNLGARMFDIRIKFDKHSIPEFRHGSMAFKGDIFTVLYFLNAKKDTYVRLILETKKQNKTQEDKFIKFCTMVEVFFPHITFFCGRRKYDWKQLYKFKTNDIAIVQKVSSMTGTVLDDWCPWFYAKFNNKKNCKYYSSAEWLVLDFIQYIQ